MTPGHWTINYKRRRELAAEKAKRNRDKWPGPYDGDNAPESPTEAGWDPIREGEN